MACSSLNPAQCLADHRCQYCWDILSSACVPKETACAGAQFPVQSCTLFTGDIGACYSAVPFCDVCNDPAGTGPNEEVCDNDCPPANTMSSLCGSKAATYRDCVVDTAQVSSSSVTRICDLVAADQFPSVSPHRWFCRAHNEESPHRVSYILDNYASPCSDLDPIDNPDLDSNEARFACHALEPVCIWRTPIDGLSKGNCVNALEMCSSHDASLQDCNSAVRADGTRLCHYCKEVTACYPITYRCPTSTSIGWWAPKPPPPPPSTTVTVNPIESSSGVYSGTSTISSVSTTPASSSVAGDTSQEETSTSTSRTSATAMVNNNNVTDNDGRAWLIPLLLVMAVVFLLAVVLLIVVFCAASSRRRRRRMAALRAAASGGADGGVGGGGGGGAASSSRARSRGISRRGSTRRGLHRNASIRTYERTPMRAPLSQAHAQLPPHYDVVPPSTSTANERMSSPPVTDGHVNRGSVQPVYDSVTSSFDRSTLANNADVHYEVASTPFK